MAANDLNPVSLKQLKQTYDALKSAADDLASQITSLQKQLGDLDTAVDGIVGLPSGGTNGQYLQRTSSGYAWTTVSLSSLGITATVTELNYMDGVTSNVQTQLNGKAASNHTHSLANTLSAGFMRKLDDNTTHYLRGDGTWATPPSTTYNVVSTTANGLAPKCPGNTTTFLRGDGTWATPSGYTLPEATSTTLGGVKVSEYDDACAFFFYA